MEKNKNHLIYLAGGGDEHQAFLFDEHYFSNLPENAKFLYIPIALRWHELYAGSPAWVRNLIDLHGRQDIEMETWTELNDRKFSDLEKFDTIFIRGGSTRWHFPSPD